MTDENTKSTTETSDELERMRHSFAHVLAQAALRLYPDTKLGIGPAVENGFYYELEIPDQLKEEDILPKLEKEMKEIIEEEQPITQVMIARDAAFDMLHQQGQIYKTELLQEIPDEEISFFKTGEEFIDLCRGPHVNHTGRLGAFQLTKLERVHWKNDKDRPMLYKISGVAFKTEEELKEFFREEVEKQEKEHRVIGPKRDLFSFQELTGPGLPIWLEEGTKIKKLLIDHIRKLREKEGFVEVWTPNIAKVDLFKQTGHFEFYQDQDIRPFPINKELYMLRPMATPSHIEVFRTKRRGYKNLPLKFFEFARIYREEEAKKLDGMVRTREFTQDAAHIFTDEESAVEQVQELLSFTTKVLKSFGLKEYNLQFSRRDNSKMSDYLGSEETWKQSENILIKALEGSKLVAREAVGEADFYGPKIDFQIKDIFGKDWQLSTIHADLLVPNRCKLTYTDKNSKESTPVLIHHSLIGSLERFIALLLENYSGALPLWLAPTQAVILPISDDFKPYSQTVFKKLKELGIRSKVDDRDESLQSRIRQAQLHEIPYMIVLGKQEEVSEVISVRPRSGEDLGVMKVDEFYDKFKEELLGEEN
ncbi:threonine--tRNA ligase [Candidatus Dojkabacteria bacterium]|nr:threonine--tRNA ligase [Candidatus Dojkabacteria bacterium]